MYLRVLLVGASIVFLQIFSSFDVSAQRVSRREEPVLAGRNGGIIPIPWAIHASPQPQSTFSGWDTSGLGATPNGPVFSISAGEDPFPLIVGGSFDSVGGMPTNNIALFSGYGNPTWQSLGRGVRGGAIFCTAWSNGKIFAGGSFDSAGNIAANRIAMWDSTGWHSLGGPDSNGTDSTVLAIAVLGDSLYMGGNFTYAGGLLTNYIAIWNLRTSQWEAINENGVVGVDGGVAALLPSDSGLYAGGGFRHAGGVVASKIARFKVGQWDSLGSGVKDTDGIVECFNSVGTPHYSLPQNFIVGGHFSMIGDIYATDIVNWFSYINVWSQVTGNPLQGASGTVYSIAGGVSTYVGGDFILPNPSIPKYFIALDNNIGHLGMGIDAPAFAVWDHSVFMASPHKGDHILDGYFDDVYIGGAFQNAGSYYTPHFTHWSEGAGVSEATNDPGISLRSFPNPIIEGTTLSFTLPARGHVVLTLFDDLGREVAIITNEDYNAGSYELPFHGITTDGNKVLFAVLKAGKVIKTCKLVLR